MIAPRSVDGMDGLYETAGVGYHRHQEGKAGSFLGQMIVYKPSDRVLYQNIALTALYRIQMILGTTCS